MLELITNLYVTLLTGIAHCTGGATPLNEPPGFWGCGVVVSHPLRMRRVPGSNPGVSSFVKVCVCVRTPRKELQHARPLWVAFPLAC